MNDYTKQGTKVLETAQKLGKDLDQARETTHKNFAAYQQAYEEYVTITEKNSFGVPTRDPWMAERVYLDSLATMKIIKDKFSTEMGQLFEVSHLALYVLRSFIILEIFEAGGKASGSYQKCSLSACCKAEVNIREAYRGIIIRQCDFR